MNETAGGDEDDPRLPVGRPEGQLQDLPFDYRWEVTRRHPYYQVWWRPAGRYFKGEPSSSEDFPGQGQLAAAFLRLIGVIGEAPDPATDATTLSAAVGGNFYLGDTIQPLTLRQTAKLLIDALPTADRAFLGAVFSVSADQESAADGDNSEVARRLKAWAELSRIRSPALDRVPDAPLFYLHAAASQRAITRDAERYARHWKSRRNLAERRIRTEKFSGYLQAWDVREGWLDGSYDPSRELKFVRVARKLRVPLSTVFNRYRSGFRLITGHEFSPVLWWRVCGILKLALASGQTGRFASRLGGQRTSSRHRPPVPDSVVSPPALAGRGEGVVASAAIQESHEADVDLRLDLTELINKRLSDDEIARRLDLPAAVVGEIRQRLAEFADF
jgi:hypothetical protein